MKFWAMTIFMLKGKIEPLCEVLEKKVNTLALQLWCETLGQYEKIMALNDQKRRIVNLKVLQERMLSRLSEQERTYLLLYAAGESMQTIADRAGISKSGASRKIDAALYKCVQELKHLNYSEKRLNDEYSEIALVHRTKKKLKCSSFGRGEWYRHGENVQTAKQGKEEIGTIAKHKDGKTTHEAGECALRYPVRGEPLAAYPTFCGIKEA